MLNKNDPLISAVQQVMQRNNAEREAVKTVNEKFGVTDRKALPHEKQGAWDAEYKQVLSESVEALDEQLYGDQPNIDVAKPYGKLTKHDFKKLRSMEEENIEEADEGKPGLMFKKIAAKAAKRYGSEEAGNRVAGAIRAKMAKAGKLEEDETSPSSMGIKKPDYALAGTTPDYAKPKEQTVNRAAKTSLPAGTMKESNISEIQEEIAYNLAEQASYVYENYGEEGLNDFINSLTEEQIDILEAFDSDSSDNRIRKINEAVNKFRAQAGGLGIAPAASAKRKVNSPMPNSGTASSWTGPAGSMNPMDRRTDMQRATQNASNIQRPAPRPGEKVPGEKVATNTQLTAQASARKGFGSDAGGGNYKAAQKLPRNPANFPGDSNGKGPAKQPTNWPGGRPEPGTLSDKLNQAGKVAPSVAASPSNKVAMTARKIEAPGRQVSASEIMNSQQYKQGVKAVGGEKAARQIKPGTNVAGVGTIEKGSSIYKTVEKNLSRTAVPGFERGNTKGGAGR